MRDHGWAVKATLLGVACLVLGAARVRAEPLWPPDLVYTPGRGLAVGRTGLTLGGYSNVELVRDEGGPVRLTFDELALFVTWDPLERVHLFSELEGEDIVTVDDDGHGGADDAEFTVERLYGDLALTDWLNVRAGKFLTPVGRWNVIHAAPLVWTTSRPLVTEQPFDPHTTGAAAFGTVETGAGAATYQLFGQFADQLDPEETPTRAERSVGARLEWAPATECSIGGTYLAFLEDDRWNHLTGLDGLWRHGPFEVMGEFADVAEVGGSDRWGLYLQGVAEVLPRIYLVGRYEHERPRRADRTVNVFVGGAAWKPWPTLVLKAEYEAVDHPTDAAPAGFRASVAALF